MNTRNSLTRIFFNGLAVVLPVAILVATVFWLVKAGDVLFSTLLRPFGPNQYIPGTGLLTAIVLCFIVGLLMKTTLGTSIVAAWHRVLDHIPLIKSLYGAVEDILDSFSKEKRHRFNRVVKVHFEKLDCWLIGFVTREDLSDLPNGHEKTDDIAVYLPMSYQIGGYLVLVPKSKVRPLDLSVEDASRLILTAGMSIRKTNNGD